MGDVIAAVRRLLHPQPRGLKLESVGRAERGDWVRMERDNEGGGDGGAERGSRRRGTTAGGAAGCGGS